MMTLLSIEWNVDPAIFTIPAFFNFGPREIRWYALMFLIGYAIGYQIVQRMWKREKLDMQWLDPLLFYTFFGMFIGARLGHCLFYDPI
jgi:prolipoprotein diacylglyceryltransferase